tara:strand:- start:9321 stop:10085 length:765 start_codon:yes stop_codon:yes gene_type:complete
MIRHLILMMVVTLSVNSSFAQKGKLSFEFGVGLNSYSMRNLNQFYIDSFAEKFELLDNPIKKGLNGFTSVKFQPTELFDIGVYGGYQYGETRSNIEFIFIDNFGDQYETHNGTFLLKTEAIIIGLTNSWYISHLLKFQNKESTFLQNFRFATELNAGVGFSKVTSDVQYPTFKQATFYEFFTSTDFQGQVALKFEYDYVTKPIIGTIGVKIGYQYFKTKTVKDRYNEEWIVLDEYPINLDFSGIFGAIYLSFGK